MAAGEEQAGAGVGAGAALGSAPSLRPESALHAKLLRLSLRQRECEGFALSVDHLAPDGAAWPTHRDGRELHGGVLWFIIDRNHGEIRALLAAAW